LGHLQEAVSLDSGSEPAWRLLGICHLHRKEPREATACLDMARRIEPNDPDLRVALGMLHMASGLPAFAEGEFRKAIELSPQCGDAYCALAVIKARQNRFDEAFHLLEQARKAGGCDAAGTEAAVRKMQDKSSQAAAEGK
jgi:Flp pilus assembly protein TadD